MRLRPRAEQKLSDRRLLMASSRRLMQPSGDFQSFAAIRPSGWRFALFIALRTSLHKKAGILAEELKQRDADAAEGSQALAGRGA